MYRLNPFFLVYSLFSQITIPSQRRLGYKPKSIYCSSKTISLSQTSTCSFFFQNFLSQLLGLELQGHKLLSNFLSLENFFDLSLHGLSLRSFGDHNIVKLITKKLLLIIKQGTGECEYSCQDKQKAFNFELKPVNEESSWDSNRSAGADG